MRYLQRFYRQITAHLATLLKYCVLKVNWDLARQYEIWPYNLGLLTPEVVSLNIEVGIESGLLDPSAADLAFEDIVDIRPGQAALEMVGGEVDPATITG